jgi:hypothetical protein
LVRLRESFTREDYKAMEAVDAEVVRHPMPKTTDSRTLAKRLVGQWQSPRRSYFYHPNGTWASNEDTPKSTGSTWRIEGNKFFQNYQGDQPARGEIIILLSQTDFIYGTHIGPYYLRRGAVYPWR